MKMILYVIQCHNILPYKVQSLSQLQLFKVCIKIIYCTKSKFQKCTTPPWKLILLLEHSFGGSFLSFQSSPLEAHFSENPTWCHSIAKLPILGFIFHSRKSILLIEGPIWSDKTDIEERITVLVLLYIFSSLLHTDSEVGIIPLDRLQICNHTSFVSTIFQHEFNAIHAVKCTTKYHFFVVSPPNPFQVYVFGR